MKILNRDAEVALNALQELHMDGGRVSARLLAKRLREPQGYVSQILQRLRKLGFVRSDVVGRKAGYTYARVDVPVSEFLRKFSAWRVRNNSYSEGRLSEQVKLAIFNTAAQMRLITEGEK